MVVGDYGKMVPKRSINDVGMKGAPGSSINVNNILYVMTDDGVRYNVGGVGGPAKRNNNPGNITVNDTHPKGWEPDIGAYRGRNTAGRFAIFPTPAAGRRGAIAWAKRSSTMGLLSYVKSYAPDSEPPNDPRTYADTVAKHVNAVIVKRDPKAAKRVGDTTLISEIIALDLIDAFIDGQIVAEGYDKPNVDTVPRDSPKLPAAVRSWAAGFDSAAAAAKAIADKVAPPPRPSP